MLKQLLEHIEEYQYAVSRKPWRPHMVGDESRVSSHKTGLNTNKDVCEIREWVCSRQERHYTPVYNPFGAPRYDSVLDMIYSISAASTTGSAMFIFPLGLQMDKMFQLAASLHYGPPDTTLQVPNLLSPSWDTTDEDRRVA